MLTRYSGYWALKILFKSLLRTKLTRYTLRLSLLWEYVLELISLLELVGTQYKLIVTVIALLSFPLLLKLTKKLLEKAIRGKIDLHRKYRA